MAPLDRRRVSAAFVLGVVVVAAWLWPRSVDAACTVSVSSGVSFGPYNVFAGTSLDSTGQFTWRCDLLTFPNVRITLTKGGSSTYLPRRMHSGVNALGYNIYRDSARTSIWGDETEGTAAYYQQYRGWGTYTVTLHGRIPAGQDAAVGSYSDTVTVVVNF
jgi:spore coat protein U-like protein